MMKIGILLSGCGFYDGTDVAEAVLAALALERRGVNAVYLCPDVPLMHTVDHLSGSTVEGDRRQVAAEAARIARGRVRFLQEQVGGELMGLIIPGGQGAVKNLMTNFGRIGKPHEVLPVVRELLDDLVGRKSPIGSISLGRAIVQSFLGESLSEEDMAMASREILVDERRRLSFTPGFLSGGSLSDVGTGIERLAESVIGMSQAGLTVLQ
ncbi:MAG: hypothetical protein ACE5HU_08055 [Acidobacteriota bacterium]